jgi:hypothetical protein
MTDQEITAVVHASNMAPEDQNILLKRALNGDNGARFIVFGMKRRQGKRWDSSVGRYGAWI